MTTSNKQLGPKLCYSFVDNNYSVPIRVSPNNYNTETITIVDKKSKKLLRASPISPNFEVWLNSHVVLKERHYFYNLKTNFLVESNDLDNKKSKFLLVLGKSNLNHIYIQARIIHIEHLSSFINVYARPITPTILNPYQKILNVIPYNTSLDNYFLFDYVIFVKRRNLIISFVRNYLFSIVPIIIPPQSKTIVGSGLRIHPALLNSEHAFIISPINPSPDCDWTIEYTLMTTMHEEEAYITFVNFSDKPIAVKPNVPFGKVIKLDVTLYPKCCEDTQEETIDEEIGNIKQEKEEIGDIKSLEDAQEGIYSGYGLDPNPDDHKWSTDFFNNSQIKLANLIETNIF